MKFVQDDRFRQERETYGFHFNCEDCAFFIEGELEACIHRYPDWEHRRKRYLDHDAYLAFCKEFSLL